MSWDRSLVRISTYEVEVLQKRLAEVAGRRVAAEEALAVMLADADAEAAKTGGDPEAACQRIRFLDGVRLRKAAAEDDIRRLLLEEAGAREALAQAFEEQKKYEQVSENLKRARDKETARRETAALDEIGLRRAAAAQ